ncbi:DoxX family protein [Georgenia sp. H159]|uniref:DoxX family protein n=1 Tax=Georgenia sp. H159 TaxID=3076115 RepID=UPI002D78B2EE|nr:DoxX family protein [Georgenia sp. H159]
MRLLLHPGSASTTVLDAALLISRVAIGLILFVHGWQKLTEFTLAGTAAFFGDMGVPAAEAAAVFVTVVELVGGAALILGLLTPLMAALNMVSLLGAFFIVHAPNGLFVENNGYELVLALLAGLLLLVVLGGGRFSVDGLIGRRLERTTEPQPVAVDA